MQNNMRIRSELGIVVGYETNNMRNLKVLMIDREEIVVRNKYVDTVISTDMIKAINNIYIQLSSDKVSIPNEVALMTHTEANRDNSNDTSNMTIDQAYQIIDKCIVDDAVRKEIDNMTEMNVWTKICDDELGNHNIQNIIPCKIFIKQKFLPDGSFEKVKARLVAGGHKQVIEYEDLYAPTININVLYMIISINTILKGDILVTDVPTAYLHAVLNEDVYMKISKNIVDIMNVDKKYVNGRGEITVKLNKCLYGLRQSGNQWYQTLSQLLLEIGFKQCVKEKCLFYNIQNGHNIIMVHVDDIIAIFKCKQMELRFKTALKEKYSGIQFESKDIHYLGMKFEKMNDGGTSLSQPGYIYKMLDKYKVQKEFNSPSNLDFFETFDEREASEDEKSRYKSILMSLMYLAVRTRPDILKEVTYLATIVNPGPIAFGKIDRIMGYIRKTAELGIGFNSDAIVLRMYCDASYGIHYNGRSHSGIVITIGNRYCGPVLVKSKVQKIVTLSSTESEMVALVEGMQWLITLNSILLEIGINVSKPVVLQDNQSVLHLIKNGEGAHGRNRHMRIKWNFIKELIDSQIVDIQYCKSSDMVADLLTKPLSGKMFWNQRNVILNNNKN
jgi:hypothetical protein